MKLMKNRVVINFATSFLYQISSLLVCLILPKIYTETFGSVYNGLNQSITQVMGLLAIFQYGIAASSIQAMFKPIAENNYEQVSAIYRYTGRIYTKMGYIFLSVLLPVILLFPFIIKDDLSYWIIVCFFVLRGVSSAMEYFFQGKYSVLLVANNCSYLVYAINTLLQFISLALHLTVLFTLKNILIYQSVAVLVTFIRLVLINTLIKKKFPYLSKYKDSNIKSIDIKQRGDVLVSEVAGLIIDSTDLIVLSSIVGLVGASIYSIYNFVILGLKGFLGSAREAVIGALGKKYYQDKDAFRQHFHRFETVYYALLFAIYSVAILMFSSFIRIYTMKMDADYMIPGLPILFVLAALLVGLRIPAIVAINTAGHFKEVKRYAIIEAVINLSISCILAIPLGIKGVLYGTILAAMYRTPILIWYTYKHILQEGVRCYFVKTSIFTIVFIICFLLSRYINVITFLGWFAYAIIITVVILGIFLGLVYYVDKGAFEYLRALFSKKQKNEAIV